MKAKTLIRLTRIVPNSLLRLAVLPPTRGIVLGQIFKRMPEMLTPTGRKATGVIRFDIGDRDSVDTWYVSLDNGVCGVSRPPETTRPRAKIIVSAFDFVQLATGADPIVLFAAGKLRLAGDTYFGASIGELFDIGG